MTPDTLLIGIEHSQSLYDHLEFMMTLKKERFVIIPNRDP